MFLALNMASSWGTPPKTNMEPENNLLEKEKHLHTSNFWGASR